MLVLDKEVTDQKLLAVTNRIEADSQKQRANALLNRVEELEKNLTQATNKLISLGASPGSGNDPLLNKRPPSRSARFVKGTVRLRFATSGSDRH